MSLSDLFVKVSPLFFYMALGYLAGRFGKVHKEGLAKFLIYFLSPALIFTQMLRSYLSWGDLFLPAVIFGLGSFISLFYYLMGGSIWPRGTKKNLLGFAAGNANSGYFGIPIAEALLGTQSVALVILCSMGYIIYENSVGFYWAARGHSSVRQALLKVAKLPGFHAAWLGIVINLGYGQIDGTWISSVNQSLRGAYSILGVSMVGMAISELKKFRMDLPFTLTAFSSKYLAWPIGLYLVVFLNDQYFQIFDAQTAAVLKLIGWVPLAANTVAIAAELKTEPELASMAVFISTIFSLLWIPFVMTIFGA